MIAMIVLIGGCLESHNANYAKLGLIPVTGKISLDGAALPDAVVFFEQTSGTKSYATTDENGNYRMKFNSKVDGVLAGEVIVRISTTAKTGELSAEDGDPDAPKKPKKVELVPKAYHKDSNLKLTIPSGNNVFNFDLKSDGSTTGPS